MTVTLSNEEKWAKINGHERKSNAYFFSHPKYVVPAEMLKDVIEQHHKVVQARVSPMHEFQRGRALYEDEGWREFIASDMAQILRSTPVAVIRRLWGVMNGEAKVVNVCFAEAACMAMGIELEIDTNLPVLPGNKVLATDLVTIRAENHGEELPQLVAKRLGIRAWKLSGLIVRYPHHLELLRDMAPYDCLRP